MDRSLFYAMLRKRDCPVFGTRITQGQVDGTENLLDVWEQDFGDGELDELAYDLATAYHETAHTMQPILERGSRRYFDKYEPGTRIGKVLGNTEPGDGYRFRGEGHVMNTGRRNARVATIALNRAFNLGVDLVAHPDQRGDPIVSALSLFLGNREGWWTGRQICDYLDGVDEADDEDLREFISARAVVNGSDRAELIGRYVIAFEHALRAAGYAPRAKPPQESADARGPVQATDIPAAPGERAPARLPAGKTAGIGAVLLALGTLAATFWDRICDFVEGFY